MAALTPITTNEREGTRASARKLYLPYSTLPTHVGPGRGKVTFHWFCTARAEPIEDYAPLILGYKALALAAQERAERLVSELFREDEYLQLRAFLESRYGVEVRTGMLTTPLTPVKPDSGTRLGTLRPWYDSAAESVSPEVKLFPLSEEAHYTLPFTVWGAYLSAARHASLIL